MVKAKWIKAVEFCNKNNVTTSNLYVQKHNGNLPSHIFRPYDGKVLLVNESFIYRHRAFKDKIQRMNQDKYFELTEKLTTYKLALLLSKIIGNNRVAMYNWMRDSLFTIDASSVLKYKVNDMQSKFFRATRHMTVGNL